MRRYLGQIDDSVFSPLFSRVGRPSVSPVLTFGALLIQLEKGCSDREFEEESRFDERYKYALGVSRDFLGIDAVTLCDHRTRFMHSGIIFALFADLFVQAKENMALDGIELLLVRVAENKVGDTWPRMRNQSERIRIVEIDAPEGKIVQRTDITPAQKRIFSCLLR